MRKLLTISLGIIALALLATGCNKKKPATEQQPLSPAETTTTETQPVTE